MSQQPQPRVYTPVWLAPADVTRWLNLNGQGSEYDAALVEGCCAQTELHVQRCRSDQYASIDPEEPDTPPVYDPDAEVYQGAVMYAARQVRRRNSPAGVQSFGDAGISFVSRFDPDIDRALHTGDWALPGVG